MAKLLFAITLLQPLLAQEEVKSPSFEVASIRPNKSGERAADFEILPTRLTVRNATIRAMIMFAWHVRLDQMTGGPAWVDTDHFDVDAKTPGPGASLAEERQMMRNLLADRFKLAIQTGEKIMPVFVLEPAKGGAKPPSSPDSGPQSCGPVALVDGKRQVTCQHMTMASLVDVLPGFAPAFIDLPVVDQTGLDGQYEISLAWVPAKGDSPGDQPGPTVFDALRDIGLKLERRTHAMPTIAIDHIDRIPTEN
jgi:uncharacterized protein (TIGR03435 family)